jgi:hypothetical protein
MGQFGREGAGKIVTHGNGLLITAIFWGAIVRIVFISNFFGYREHTSRHRMPEKLAEKGQPIPPEILNGNGPYYDDSYRGGWHRYSLAGGIYMICDGFSASVARRALALQGRDKLLDQLVLLATAAVILLALPLGHIAAAIETVTAGLENLLPVIIASGAGADRVFRAACGGPAGVSPE